MLALIEGGVDILLIETCQDILQTKAALVAAFEARRQSGKQIPIQVQVTLEATGTMLLGTEIGAALTTLEVFDVDAIGLNCATGPAEMNDAVRYLSVNSQKAISVLPNAGLRRTKADAPSTSCSLRSSQVFISTLYKTMVCASSAGVAEPLRSI
jgi:5-methyltetrahydrofolate--homocysteine methyltransferase